MLKKSLRSRLLLFTLSLAAHASDSVSISTKWSGPDGRPGFISHEGHLAIPFPHDEMARLKEQLQKRDGVALFDNSETHLKVITHSEWRILNQRLTMLELETLAEKRTLMKMAFTPKCLGRVETFIKNKRDYSWVLVGDAEEVRQFRREVWRFYMTKGGQGPDFQWKRWSPTITVASSVAGFDEEIAHKDRPSCVLTVKAL